MSNQGDYEITKVKKSASNVSGMAHKPDKIAGSEDEVSRMITKPSISGGFLEIHKYPSVK